MRATEGRSQTPEPFCCEVGRPLYPAPCPNHDDDGHPRARVPLAPPTDLNQAFYAASDWLLDMRDSGIDLTTEAHRKVAAEGAELADDPSLEEWADVFIALVGVASANLWTAGDLAGAVRRKVLVNRRRLWVKQPDGTFQHATDHASFALCDCDEWPCICGNASTDDASDMYCERHPAYTPMCKACAQRLMSGDASGPTS